VGALSLAPSAAMRVFHLFVQFNQHLRVALLGGATSILALAATVQRCHKRRLPHDQCAVFRDDFVARAITSEHDGLPHLLGRPT